MLVSLLGAFAILAQGAASSERIAECRAQYKKSEEVMLCVYWPWALGVVEWDEWTIATGNENFVVLTKLGPRPRMTWLRYEYANSGSFAGQRFLSGVQLVESDCETGRTRFLQGTVYERSNMKGEPTNTMSEPTVWSYPIPGSIAEIATRGACATAKEPRNSPG